MSAPNYDSGLLPSVSDNDGEVECEPEELNLTQASNAKKKRKIYDGDRIDKAVAEMKVGMSARQAALKWDVPRTKVVFNQFSEEGLPQF